MNCVNTLRRIDKINEALCRIDECDERYDDIWNKLWDKHDTLVKSIKDYIKCPDKTNKELRYRTFIRRKQVLLACRYLNIDYYRL